VSPPEQRGSGRWLHAAATSALVPLAALLVLCGCGKSDLTHTSAQNPGGGTAPRATGHAAGRVAPQGGPAPAVAVPLPLSAARAARFARAVTLRRVDLPGASPAARSKTPAAQEREAAQCGQRSTPVIGGGRSPNFQRGDGLDRESISSGVEVLSDAGAVQGDLAYSSSRAGLACYAKVLAKSLRGEQDSQVRLLGLHVRHLQLAVGSAGRASGIRIMARVGLTGVPITVSLFVDALSLPYGPAELDLYSTSFVQPVPVRTQQELLGLLRERAQQQRL
jgi:hypothetical protein